MSETTINKPYEFRMLGAEDVFPMVNIISKIGIKEFKSLFEGDGLKGMMSGAIGDAKKKSGGESLDEASIVSLGASVFLELATIILCNLPKAEKDIFQLLSNTSNLSVDEIKKLGLADFTEMVIDFFKKDEFKDFMKVVSKLFK
jgi:hypothetical protein